MRQTKEKRSQVKHDWYMRNKAICIERQRQYRQNNKSKVKNYDKKHSKMLYAKHKDMLDKIKYTNGCAICGQTKGMLDFHHVNPSDKLFNIATAKHKSNTELVNEINKCIVVCRKCHAKIHLDDKTYDKMVIK